MPTHHRLLGIGQSEAVMALRTPEEVLRYINSTNEVQEMYEFYVRNQQSLPNIPADHIPSGLERFCRKYAPSYCNRCYKWVECQDARRGA